MALTGAALLLCVLFVWGFWTWFQPPPGLAAGVALLALGMFLLWPFYFGRRPARAGLRPRAATGATGAHDPADPGQLTALLAEFDALGFAEGAEQLLMLHEKFRTLNEVLDLCLDAREPVHARYLGNARQVYLAALDHLRDLAIVLRSISTIDPAALALRIRDLKQRQDFPVPDAIRAVEERRTLYEGQRRRIATLLSQTETAMTALDHACAALAGGRSAQGLTAAAIDDAMKDLVQLAQRSAA